MSLQCRQVRGRLACMAGLGMVALALVACGQATSSTAEPVAVRIEPVTLEVGAAPYQISLSNKFSGSELTYTATSDKTAVATAKVDGATLTVTAVGAGKATITVTATDPQDRSARTSFTVTVDRPTAPDPDPVEISDIPSLEEDATRTIRLGDKFRGTGLTYTAESNRTSVATVAVDNDADTLTVTAVGPGTATITVTATAQGSAPHQTQTFTVTVPDPEVTPPGETPTETPTTNRPSNCPSPLPSSLRVTLVIDRGLSGECTLPSDHSLIYEHPSARVSVQRPGIGAANNTWVISALKKGRPVVFIHDDQAGRTVGEITVIVPNIPPRLMPSKRDPQDEGALLPTTVIPAADGPADSYAYITDTLNPGAHFEDDDPEDTDEAATQVSLRYKISYAPPGVLIDTDRGFIEVGPADADGPEDFNIELTKAAFTMKAAILKRPDGPTFNVQLYAYDRDNGRSDNAVTLEFTSDEPEMGMYAVGQDSDGNFTYKEGQKKLRVGNRLGVDHGLGFGGNFTFAEIAASGLAPASGDKKLDSLTHTGASMCTAGDPPEKWTKNNSTLGRQCYRIKSSSPTNVSVQFPSTFDGSSPSATFKILKKTSGVTITIEYHVWALTTAMATIPSDAAELAKLGQKRYRYYKPLGLDIHKCVETTDCPLK